jgi:hypothetical protein
LNQSKQESENRKKQVKDEKESLFKNLEWFPVSIGSMFITFGFSLEDPLSVSSSAPSSRASLNLVQNQKKKQGIGKNQGNIFDQDDYDKQTFR